jgi:predicted molibdopterin-dependent oxidoreductase YjgC
VVVSLELGELEPYADAVLPAAALFERDGHVTDWEGRPQRNRAVRQPVGLSRPEWEIFAGLARVTGDPLGFETLEQLRAEAARLLGPRSLGERSTAWAGTGRPQWAEDLTLFTYPLLVDEGRLSAHAEELKVALEEEPFVEIHPDDAAKRGIADGDRVQISTDAGASELPARVTEHVAAGSMFVPFNQPGLAANTLLSGRFTAGATVEAVVAAEGAA